jgi:hypothetical protein
MGESLRGITLRPYSRNLFSFSIDRFSDFQCPLLLEFHESVAKWISSTGGIVLLLLIPETLLISLVPVPTYRFVQD